MNGLVQPHKAELGHGHVLFLFEMWFCGGPFLFFTKDNFALIRLQIERVRKLHDTITHQMDRTMLVIFFFLIWTSKLENKSYKFSWPTDRWNQGSNCWPYSEIFSFWKEQVAIVCAWQAGLGGHPTVLNNSQGHICAWNTAQNSNW